MEGDYYYKYAGPGYKCTYVRFDKNLNVLYTKNSDGIFTFGPINMPNSLRGTLSINQYAEAYPAYVSTDLSNWTAAEDETALLEILGNSLGQSVYLRFEDKNWIDSFDIMDK